MKRILTSTFILAVLFISFSIAQTQPNQLLTAYGENRILTLPDIQKSFNDYWDAYNVTDGYYFENGAKKKAAGWKIFKRWEWYWENRVNIETGEFPNTNSNNQYEKYLSSPKKLSKITYDENWVNLGTNSSTGGYAGIGRINCIAFHPTDVNTFWVGSPSGGLWKTTDGGSSWTILNNNEMVLGVSDIAIPSDYSTSNTMYIATGDRDGGSMWSLGGGQSADNVTTGIYKSTDGGSTWSATGLTFSKSSGVLITRLLIHPSNSAILYASVLDFNTVLDGIYKSTNSGTSWSLIHPYSPFLVIDMEFKPGDPNTIYASSFGYSAGYVFRTTDGGTNWSYASMTGGYRVELAVSTNNSAIVYALACNTNGGLLGVYKSTNSGTSFTRVDLGSKSMLYYYSDGSGSNIGQGSYDLCIASSPTNANIVYLGGINTWKSTDGGANWTISNMWTSHPSYNFVGAPVAHADKHALAFQNGTTLFEGNDGGLYKTTNGGTSWTDLTNGMVISQIYRIGVSQTSPTTVLTGLQDNGSKLYNGGFWSDVTGGDGMECIVDYSTTNYMYATYVRGTIYRSTNGGASFPTTISANIPGGQPTGAWVTPYIIDPNNNATLYAGYDRIWKTTNRGNTWTSASAVLSSSTKLRSLAIAPSNSYYLYTADLTNMWRTTNGGTNWTAVTLPANSNSLTYIAVKDNDPNTIWITFGGYTADAKVYESTNGGGSWTNISTGLPDLPVMCIVHYKVATNRNVLFVGTDLGVYVKDGTSDWVQFNTGLPNVVVTELEVLYTGGNNKLRAGTYGRGLWETNIDAALPVELSSFTAKVLKEGGIELSWRTETEVNNYGFEVQKSEYRSQELEWKTIGFVEGHGNSNSPKDYSFKDNVISGKYSYRLKQIDTDGTFEYSKVIEVDAGDMPEGFVLEQNYPNPFNPSTKIKFAVVETQTAKLIVFDVLANEVAVPFNGTAEGGKIYESVFDGSNLSSGIFFYRLETESKVENRKMLLLK
ncbi:MAG: hypothetical protein IPM14_05775 [bacterium]|nr:hypothetical protein [bacterium]